MLTHGWDLDHPLCGNFGNSCKAKEVLAAPWGFEGSLTIFQSGKHSAKRLKVVKNLETWS